MWIVQEVSIVWILSAMGEIDAVGIYKGCFGHDPDTFQKNKAFSPSNPTLSQASGVLSEVNLKVVIQPGRVAISFTPPDQEIELAQPNLAIDFHRAMQFAEDASKLDSGAFGTVVRVAMHLRAAMPVGTYAETAQSVFGMMKSGLPVDGATDVSFNINRRTELIPDHKVNRLVKFSIFSIELAIATDQGQLTQVNAGFLEAPSAVSLLLDLNNVPDRGVLDQDTQRRLFSAYAAEIGRLVDAKSPVEALWMD